MSLLVLARPWRRVGAALLDGLIVIPITVAFFIATDLETSARFGAVLSAVYQVVPVALWGQTLGKRALGLQVVPAASTMHQAPGWVAATLRWATVGIWGWVPLVGGVVGFVVSIIDLVLLFQDPRHQTLHDKVAGTVVVEASRSRHN